MKQSRDLIGQEILVFYRENDRLLQCFGVVLDWDDTFITLKTKENRLLIAKRTVDKVKLREGELDEYGELIPKRGSKTA